MVFSPLFNANGLTRTFVAKRTAGLIVKISYMGNMTDFAKTCQKIRQ